MVMPMRDRRQSEISNGTKRYMMTGIATINSGVRLNVMYDRVITESNTLLNMLKRSVDTTGLRMPSGLRVQRHDLLKGGLMDGIVLVDQAIVGCSVIVISLFPGCAVFVAFLKPECLCKDLNMSRVSFIS